MMMDEIKGDLAALNIRHDVFFSERSLIEGGADQVAATIAFLRGKGDVYEGRLPPPKGAPVEDYEDREQTLFRATAYGDDVDRPLKKSDGGYTYFASDIAYHKNKFDRGFTTSSTSGAPITAAISSAWKRPSRPSRQARPRWT
jgi:arginyl-tRNA synthetase